MNSINKHSSHNEAGSAYVVTLMVLFILTLVGLSLTLITQTEMLVSSTERTVQRTFYAADSGISVAVARALVWNDYQPSQFSVPNKSGGALDINETAFEDRIDVTHMVPILAAPCNLCQINQGNEFFEINHALTSTATRSPMPGAAANPNTPLARKSISAMIEIQPWKQSAEAYFIPDTSVLSDIRY